MDAATYTPDHSVSQENAVAKNTPPRRERMSKKHSATAAAPSGRRRTVSYTHLIDAKPVDFDADTRMFVFGEPTDGQTLDREALYKDVEASFAQGGGEVELQFVYTEAEVPVDRYGLIASYTTDASTSSSARIHNIRLALETINGTCLEPGEVFSFNGVVGERTEETGYRPAPAYSRMRCV